MATMEERLQRLVDRQVSKRAIRGALAAMTSADGSRVAFAAAGHADASEVVPLTADTPYFLASITKTYTATVVMQLVREKAIELHAPIGRYVSSELTEGIHVVDGSDYGAAITVEQLLFQTSGLADYFADSRKGEHSLEQQLEAGRDRVLAIEDIVALVRRLEPRFAPSETRAYYSDTNFALLGAIVESTTGAPMANAFHDRVCAPLGLATTFLFDPIANQPSPAVVWHRDAPLEIPLAMSSFVADGGMVSTLDENLRFLRGVFTGGLLTEQEVQYMTGRWNRIFFPLAYGGGLMRFRLPIMLSPYRNPGELIGHSGSTGSFAFYSPAKNMLLAGTVNQSDKPGRPYRLMSQMIAIVS